MGVFGDDAGISQVKRRVPGDGASEVAFMLRKEPLRRFRTTSLRASAAMGGCNDKKFDNRRADSA